MYINKIDELIDNIIDDFYATLMENSMFKKIIGDNNFVKNQSEINKILVGYENQIDIKEIEDIINTDESIKMVINIIKKYLAYYLFLIIGISYTGKNETFINNVLEFSKLQSGYPYKVPNFFNSDSNSAIIKYVNILKNLVTLVELDQNKLDQYAKNDIFKASLEFYKEQSSEIIESLKIENLEKDKLLQAHSMIKLMIFMELYFKIDKSEIYHIVEESQKTGEYIFIDIIVPKKEFIDFGAIENVLTRKQIDSGLANSFYELILDIDSYSSINMTADDKILSLINNKLLVPITEDFLLYHKDTEKYEKVTMVQKKKQKDDTKIRYIVSKIDSIAEYYSDNLINNPELRKNIEKHFYVPLDNRKAILVNNLEEIQIINKFYNQGNASIENSDFLSELSAYRQYPYTNFKDFNKTGFNIHLNKTIDIIRETNFNTNNLNKVIEMRTGCSDMSVNIIGFILSTNTILDCIKGNQFKNIRKSSFIGKNNNAYHATFKYLTNLIKNNNKNNKKENDVLYWFFNLEDDQVNINRYEQVGKLSKQDSIKMIIGNLYDELLKTVYDTLNEKLDSISEISYYDFYRLISYYEKKYIKISSNLTMFNNLLEKAVYEKYTKGNTSYDIKDDLFPGLDNKAKKLPKIKNKEPSKRIFVKINLEKEDVQSKMTQDIIQYGAICQHNITWDKINKYDKMNENSFPEQLIDFVYKYVIENDEKDFICKSCGIQINLKKYILDGAFDDQGGFKIFNTPIKTTIENIPEYDKYRQIIKNIDKLIDKIASISSMHILQEKSSRNKNQLKLKIIKDSLDLIIHHNRNMSEIYKKRTETINSNYGIIDSQFFIFELDNNIFQFSSKDKDTYKIIKRNNILVYTLFLILMEATDTQILYMFGDKLCSFGLFEKVGMKIMENIKIITNDNKVVSYITDYKVLCYIIFYISCMMTKYNMWNTTETTPNKKFNVESQKMIIHTLIDLINSILEVYCDNKKKKEPIHYLYDMIATRFYQKIGSTFKNNTIIDKLKLQYDKKFITSSKTTTLKIDSIMLNPDYGVYGLNKYMGIKEWKKCGIAKYTLDKKIYNDRAFYSINSATNCDSGEFHKWTVVGSEFVCTKCNKSMKSIKNDPNINEIIIKNYNNIQIKAKSHSYCPSGTRHKLYYDETNKVTKCSNCSYVDKVDASPKDLQELAKNLLNNKRIEKEKELAFGNQNVVDYDYKFLNKLKDDYKKTQKTKESSYLDSFIEKIGSITSTDVNIDNKNIYLNDDVYIIDHTHEGYKRDKPLIIKNSENKILFKKNHNYYKMDVLYYVDNQLQIEVFYNNITFLLLGYKEKNRDYTGPKEKNAYIKINYSIYSKLKYLGCEYKYTNVVSDKEKLNLEFSYIKNIDEKNTTIIKTIVKNIGRTRINNLKKIITDVQKFIYRAKYNYEIIENNELYDTKFMEKYKNKLTTIKLKSDNLKFFDNWETIKYALFFNNIDKQTINIDINDEHFDSDEVNIYDDSGNIILFYIIQEFTKLIDINEQKFIKAQIAFLLIDIIGSLFSIFNRENEYRLHELKKFKYLLESKMYVEEGSQLEGMYEEQVDPNAEPDTNKEEMIYSDEEEMDALDIDGELDYEVDYASGINFD